MRQLRHSSFRILHSLCIPHSALCIALAFAAANARAAVPAGYTAVEYIASTGVESLNTGIVPKHSTRLVCGFRFVKAPIGYAVRCGWGSSGSQESFIFGAQNNAFAAIVSGNYLSTSTDVPVDTAYHVFDLANGALKFDGATFGTMDTLGDTAAGGQTMYLFSLHAEWTTALTDAGSIEIHFCRIYDGSKLVRDFVPAVRDADGMAGLYDLVGDTFYVDRYGGSFLAGPPPAPGLSIGGDPVADGEPSPGYGNLTNLAANASIPVSAPAVWTNAEGTVSATCTGWKIYDANYAELDSGTGSSFTYAHPAANAFRRLHWQWDMDNRVGVTAESGGTATVSASWVPTDGTATFTASPAADATFVCWMNGSSIVSFDNPATLAITGPTTLRAVFSEAAVGWSYDTTAKTLTEQNVPAGATAWVFNCTVSGNSLTVASVKTAGSATAVDFRAAIDASDSQTYAITALGGSLFKSRTTLVSIRLPDSLTSIGTSAFEGCSALKTVTPFLPEAVATIGYRAFCNTAAEGTLRIGHGRLVTLETGSYGLGQNFYATKITDLDVGPGVKVLPPQFAYTCTALTNIVFAPAGLTTVGTHAFYSCTTLRRVTPFLPDTVTSIGYRAFYDAPVEGTLRIGHGGPLTIDTGDYGNGQNFQNTHITDLDAGPGVAVLPPYFAYNCSELTNIVFATAGLKTISGYAFSGCTSLRRVTPLLPDTVTSIGYRAFYNDPVEGALRIGYGGPLTIATGDYGNGQNFQGTSITAIDAGPGVATVQPYFASGCALLTNIVFTGSAQVNLSNNAFSSCPLLTNVVLRPVATWTSSSFSSTPANYYGRFLYYKTNAEWSDAIASYGTDFKNWDGGVTEAEKATYQTAFPDGPTPRGYMAVSGIKKWFVPITGVGEGEVGAYVTAQPYELGTASPAYTALATVTIPAAFSVSQYGERDGIAYESAGYRLDPMGDETWEEGETVAGARAFTLDAADADAYRVTWQWREAGYRLTVPVPESGLYTVAISGTELTDPSLTGVYYASNTIVTLTATPAAGRRFVRWYGDVPEEQADSATIYLTMDRIRTAVPYVEQGWTYFETGRTVTDGYWVLNVTGSASAYTIPSISTMSDACVCLDLTKPTDGFSFAQIGNSAFANVTTLHEVRLPDTLTTIGNYAFQNCTSLERVTPFLPDTVTSLGYAAFSSCSSLTGALRIGFANPFALGISSGSSYTFNGTQISDLAIGPRLTTITGFCFDGCASLTNVVFEETGLTSIGSYVFRNCTSLERITPFLPDTVTSIGYEAFQNCTALACSLRIGFGGALTLGTASGSGYNFAAAGITELVAGPGLTTVVATCFDGCAGLTNIVFAERGLTTLGSYAFRNCTSLRRVAPFLPDTVNSVGYEAFYNCAALACSLRIGFGGAVAWGASSGSGYNFAGAGITELVGGPDLTTVAVTCFDGCAGLTNIVFAERGLTTLGSYAFRNCTSLRRVAPFLPDTVNSIGYQAFYNCTALTGTVRLGFKKPVTFGLSSSSSQAFRNTAVSGVAGGPALTSIAVSAFYDCTSLASADFTKSTQLTTIGGSAFQGASALLDVWLNSYPTFGKNAFYGVPVNARFHLAKDVESWTTWLDNTANAKPWATLTAAEKEVYNDFWGAVARRPKARAAKSLSPFPKDSWLLRYSTDTATMLILR